MEMFDFNKNDKPIDVANFRELILENSITFESEHSLNELVDKISNAQYVLLGEALHGIH